MHTALAVLRRQPFEILRYIAGRPLRLGPHMLFVRRNDPATAELSGRLAPDPARPVPVPVPRATARRYGAEIREIDGVGHNTMLDAGWPKGWKQIESRLADGRAH